MCLRGNDAAAHTEKIARGWVLISHTPGAELVSSFDATRMLLSIASLSSMGAAFERRGPARATYQFIAVVEA